MLLPPGDEVVYQQPPLIGILNKEKLKENKAKKKTAMLDTFYQIQNINACSEKYIRIKLKSILFQKIENKQRMFKGEV